jgi:Leucine-rich repeat (LRR) protein
MKNALLILLLFTGMVKAQIISIPDANFKAALIADGIDTNGDGEIQTIEAFVVNQLHVDNADISNLIGLSSFVNVASLYCDNNNITFLDLSGNPNINYIKCSNNQLSFLNVSNNIGLTDLLCDSNNLNGINVSNNPNLTDLWLFNNNLTSLDVSSCSSLRLLTCGQNALTSLDLTSNLNLNNLQCTENQLTSLDVSGLTNLTSLYCTQNQLTSLDVSGLTSLLYLYCEFNQIPSINLNGLVNLKRFYCNGNLLTSLDFTGLTALEQVSCDENQLTTLDLSQQSLLVILRCRLNNLESLFIKNGTGNGSQLYFDGNPNIQFICVDEAELVGVELLLITYDYNNCVVNTYCTFEPGGDYNTISGILAFDNNQNGCDLTDIKPKNIRVRVNDGANLSTVFTDGNGIYNTYTQEGSFEITPIVENPTWFNFSPSTATIPFTDNNNNAATQDFCIATNGIHTDVEVVIVPINMARPGFDALYQIVYKNKGNQTASGNITLAYNDTVLDFLNATMLPDSQSAGMIYWTYLDLVPFESRSFYVTLNVNAPTDIPAVNIGDVLIFETTITPIIVDEIQADNVFSYHQTVVGSYDPNDITCIEGDVVAPSEIGNYLHYAINFENTGTFPAENVVVKTEVDDAKFDIGSLQLMNSNFPVDARITRNKVEFIFKNIQLPIGGHGHILLKIKTNATLVVGDAVANRADIFFDYNFPIDTGLANTVFQNLSNSVFEVDSSVTVYPNPAVNNLTVKADNMIKSIELYDAQGRIILTSLTDVLESKLDVSSYYKGIYFLKVITEKGTQVQKLLKD